jgi:L-rhamnose mutarotase
MRLKPGSEAAYRQKHDDIWPEMLSTLHSFGIRNYSIFLSGLTLFACYETDDAAAVARLERENPVVQRWWKMMEPYMEYNADGTPWSERIDEVFHMD